MKPVKAISILVIVLTVGGKLFGIWGLLLGIGENVAERVDTLLTIRDLDDRYGHRGSTYVRRIRRHVHAAGLTA